MPKERNKLVFAPPGMEREKGKEGKHIRRREDNIIRSTGKARGEKGSGFRALQIVLHSRLGSVAEGSARKRSGTMVGQPCKGKGLVMTVQTPPEERTT